MSSTSLFLWNERWPASWPTTNHPVKAVPARAQAKGSRYQGAIEIRYREAPKDTTEVITEPQALAWSSSNTCGRVVSDRARADRGAPDELSKHGGGNTGGQEKLGVCACLGGHGLDDVGQGHIIGQGLADLEVAQLLGQGRAILISKALDLRARGHGNGGLHAHRGGGPDRPPEPGGDRHATGRGLGEASRLVMEGGGDTQGVSVWEAPSWKGPLRTLNR